MSECVNCTNKALNTIVAQQTDGACETIVHENVCVQGTVTITPSLIVGESQSFCLGNPVIGSCPGELEQNCVFTVSQNICVQIPLTFSATATAVPNGLVCGNRDTGACANVTACTHTIGYFRNHEDVTGALLAAAGGSITLGTGAGLSYTVTSITEANAVLDLATPTPPAPDTSPLAGQYQILYAQLLAAKLNVLALTAMGVTICTYATIAIANADNFLDTSPVGGKTGAPAVQTPLATFNEGNAPGCPFHCTD